MESIASRDQIATQARQDARDAAQGAPVHCPYPPESVAAQTWTAAFDARLAQLSRPAGPKTTAEAPAEAGHAAFATLAAFAMAAGQGTATE